MLLVPRRRQPDPIACLPTCIWSVLTFQGNTVDYEEVVAACRLDWRGAVLELAIQSLREAGWDVEVVSELDMEQVRAALAEDRPLIASMLPEEAVGDLVTHAIVICGLSDETITVMDPLLGDYVSLPLAEAAEELHLRFSRGLFIAGIPEHLDTNA